MTVTTVYAGAADGRIQSSDSTYATARAGAALAVNNTGTVSVEVAGQWFAFSFTHYIWEGFFGFDTSGIADSDTIDAVAFSLYGSNTHTASQEFVMEVRASNWGGTLTTADWVAGASLSALTRLATFNTTGFSTSGYFTFTEDGTNFRAAINKTGTTYFLVDSDRHVAGTAPAAAEEYEMTYWADNTGTTNDPKLVVTSTAGAVTRTLTGAQPAPSGTLTRVQQAPRTVTGAQAAASGTLSRQKTAPRALTGTQAAPGGTLTRGVKASARTLTGTQPIAWAWDDFNRTENPSDIGPAGGGKAWWPAQGQWGNAGGSAYDFGGVLVDHDVAFLEGDGPNGVLTAKITMPAGGDPGLAVRGIDQDHYVLAHSAGLYLLNSGFSLLSAYTGPGFHEGVNLVRVELHGLQIKVFVDDVVAVDYTLTGAAATLFTTPTLVGIRENSTTGASYFDNFFYSAGSLTRILSAQRAPAGSQPSASGGLSATHHLVRTVAGVQGVPSSTLIREVAHPRSPSGIQPAASGSLTRTVQALQSPSGTQPTPSGTLTHQLQAQRLLSGTQLSATGTLSRIQAHSRVLSGPQPAPSATLSRIAAMACALEGVQLSAGGVLTQQLQTARLLSGTQALPFGTVTAVRLVTTSTREVGIDAALLATGSRTVPLSAAAGAFLDRNVPLSTALLASLSCAVPVTGALQASRTATVPLTAALEATLARSVPASGSLSATGVRTVPLSGAVFATAARTVSFTVALSTTGVRTVSLSATLSTSSVRVVPLSATLGAFLERTVPLTGALAATGASPVPLTAATQASLTRAVPLSAALSVTGVRSVPLSVSLSGALTRLVPLTGVLRATESRLVALSSALSQVGTRTVTLTASIAVEYAVSAPLTAALSGQLARAVPLTLALSGTGVRTVPVTTALGAYSVRLVPLSGALGATFAHEVPLDASLQAQVACPVPLTVALEATLVRAVPLTTPLATTELRVVLLTASIALRLIFDELDSPTRALGVGREATENEVLVGASQATVTGVAPTSTTELGARITRVLVLPGGYS